MTLKRTSWLVIVGTVLLLQAFLIWQLWQVQALAPIRESRILITATLILILTALLCVGEQWLHRRLTREIRLTGDQLRLSMKSLLEAHELERERIARELHDDIGQRMAVMTMDLDSLMHLLPLSTADLRVRIATMSNRAIDLAKDVQAISHRLHSSKLEHLGIALAAAAFCHELSQRHGVAIPFSAGEMPDKLPKDVALCLFRVLQEAVDNAVRHGHPRQVTVELSASDADVRLDIVDDGIGFDPVLAMKGPGLGLISMHERLGLIGGELRI